MNRIEQQFQVWERYISESALRPKRQEDGSLELRPQPSSAQLIAANKLKESWAQKYVKEEFKRLGFSKVEGPYHTGPDFKVFRNRRWAMAEVETTSRNYFKHGHTFNPKFSGVRYLILLSSVPPPAADLPELPPEIIHIDHEHFLNRFQTASKLEAKGYRDTIRIALVAGAMQQHWTTICSDAEREMSTCPDCDSCAYFGDGMFREATPHFESLAAKFVVRDAMTDNAEPDLTKIRNTSLRQFVEKNPPQ